MDSLGLVSDLRHGNLVALAACPRSNEGHPTTGLLIGVKRLRGADEVTFSIELVLELPCWYLALTYCILFDVLCFIFFIVDFALYWSYLLFFGLPLYYGIEEIKTYVYA